MQMRGAVSVLVRGTVKFEVNRERMSCASMGSTKVP